MKKDITRFRSCLKDIYKGDINQKLVDLLVKKGAIIFEKEEEDPLFPEFPMHFNKKSYTINGDVYRDIYNILEDYNSFAAELFGEEPEELIEEIQNKVFAEFDKNSKIKFLKDYRRKILMQTGKNNYQLYKNYCLSKKQNTPTNNAEDWYSKVVSKIIFNSKGIKDYFTLDFYNEEHDAYFDSHLANPKYSTDKESILNPNHTLNIEWQEVIVAIEIVAYIESKIIKVDKGEDKNEVDTSRNTKSQTYLYTVIFLDELWKKNQKNKVDYQKSIKYVGHLTGFSFYDKEFQISCLGEYLNTHKVQYKQFNASDLAKIFNEITNKDFDRLRKYSAVLKKTPTEYSNAQKKLFKDLQLTQYNVIENIKDIE